MGSLLSKRSLKFYLFALTSFLFLFSMEHLHFFEKHKINKTQFVPSFVCIFCLPKNLSRQCFQCGKLFTMLVEPRKICLSRYHVIIYILCLPKVLFILISNKAHAQLSNINQRKIFCFHYFHHIRWLLFFPNDRY